MLKTYYILKKTHSKLNQNIFVILKIKVIDFHFLILESLSQIKNVIYSKRVFHQIKSSFIELLQLFNIINI